MPEDATTTPGAAPVAPAQASEPTPNVTDSSTSIDPLASDLLTDLKEEEAKLKGDEPPAKKEEEVKPKADDTPKTEDEDKEPEGLTDAEKNRAAWMKNQRDKNLKQANDLAIERAEFEKQKAELAKRESEIAGKTQKTETTPEGTPALSADLEHFKPVTLSAYEDGENPNELALKTGLEGLAKDVQSLKTLLTSSHEEITRLKTDNERLMKLAEPHMPDADGNTPAMIAEVANTVSANVAKAVDTLTGQYGPDSGLTLDPVTMIAAFREYADGFKKIGEIKDDSFFSPESFIRCYEHAYRNEIAAAKAKSGKQPEEKPKAPPLGEGGGKASTPVSDAELSDSEFMLKEYKLAASNGRR